MTIQWDDEALFFHGTAHRFWADCIHGKGNIRSTYTLSSRPERTRISCHAAPDTATYAAFVKESRMEFASATNLHRKSGGAEWRDLRFLLQFSHIL